MFCPAAWAAWVDSAEFDMIIDCNIIITLALRPINLVKIQKLKIIFCYSVFLH